MDAESISVVVSQSLSNAIMTESANLLPSPVPAADPAMVGGASSSWIGFVWRMLVALLQFAFALFYWVVRIVTITIPTLLFSLLSSTWTVTMNATTLYV